MLGVAQLSSACANPSANDNLEYIEDLTKIIAARICHSAEYSTEAEVMPVSFQPKVDRNGLKLRRSFVALAYQRGVGYEYQQKPEP